MSEPLKGWDNEKRPVERGYPPNLVQEHCVRNTEWQKFRLFLKGQPTYDKLTCLEDWWDLSHEMTPIATEVQVGNYLGALRRGGQLDANNQIRKYI